jgi:hypothetical protein
LSVYIVFFRSLHSNDRTSLCLCIFPYHYEWTGCSRMLGLDVNSFSERLVFLLELSQQTTSQWNQSRRVTFFVRRCYVRSQGCQLMDWLMSLHSLYKTTYIMVNSVCHCSVSIEILYTMWKPPLLNLTRKLEIVMIYMIEVWVFICIVWLYRYCILVFDQRMEDSNSQLYHEYYILHLIK